MNTSFEISLLLVYVISIMNTNAFTIDKILRIKSNTNLYKITMIEKRGPADNDFISKLFGKLLPKPEDLGLKRYDSITRPENYPCVKDQWATLLPEDKDNDLKLIRQLLSQTNLEYRPLKLAYSASKDGWKASIFHDKVDKLGPAVVLCKTITGGILGGYNPTGWVNLGEYRGSIAAFLFVFPDGNTNNRPIKLAKIAGAGLAQIDDGSGPRFGMEGLTIPLSGGNITKNKSVRSKLGLYYERLPNNKNSLLPNNNAEDELVELKVFVGIYDLNERIPYSDALPYQLN